jgi:hypothetical protein
MAVFRTDPTPANGHDDLVREFQAELARGRDVGQPYVFVNDIGQTHTYHVTAVWDRWKALTPPQRSRVIIDAMNRHDPATIGRITIAMGLTGAEAKRMGILPYAVQLLPRRHELGAREGGVEFLKRHGGFETDEGLELLFRDEETAAREYERLKAEAPHLPWALAHGVATVRD